LDVFQTEPYRPNGGDLRALENVILTPHLASNTVAACERMARAAWSNIEFCERGEIARMTLAPH
jgi:phosphoglycerate dehydrogenase-like enzyme